MSKASFDSDMLAEVVSAVDARCKKVNAQISVIGEPVGEKIGDEDHFSVRLWAVVGGWRATTQCYETRECDVLCAAHRILDSLGEQALRAHRLGKGA